MLVFLFYSILAACGFIVILTAVRSRCFFRSLCASALQGTCAFFAVNLLGAYLGIHLPLNLLTVAIGILGGIPGIILLLVTDLLYLF